MARCRIGRGLPRDKKRQQMTMPPSIDDRKQQRTNHKQQPRNCMVEA
jgi:hypothetical protein